MLGFPFPSFTLFIYFFTFYFLFIIIFNYYLLFIFYYFIWNDERLSRRAVCQR